MTTTSHLTVEREVDQRLVAATGCDHCGHEKGGTPVTVTGGDRVHNGCTDCLAVLIGREFGQYIDLPDVDTVTVTEFPNHIRDIVDVAA